MSASLQTIEDDIARERDNLNAWLDDAYAGKEDQRYYGEMDASYPNWAGPESVAGFVFDHGLVQRLSTSSVDSLLFFISRSDEIGGIIAWLSPVKNSPFSWCGKLSYSDFLYLCEQALTRVDDFCDYQLAACFRKCKSLDERAIDVLNRFFHKQYSYTRRVALQVFEEFALPQTVELAIALWDTDDCEFAKLSCLHALKKFPRAKPHFDKYLHEYKSSFNVDAETYRQSHMRQLTASRAT